MIWRQAMSLILAFTMPFAMVSRAFAVDTTTAIEQSREEAQKAFDAQIAQTQQFLLEIQDLRSQVQILKDDRGAENHRRNIRIVISAAFAVIFGTVIVLGDQGGASDLSSVTGFSVKVFGLLVLGASSLGLSSAGVYNAYVIVVKDQKQLAAVSNRLDELQVKIEHKLLLMKQEQGVKN